MAVPKYLVINCTEGFGILCHTEKRKTGTLRYPSFQLVLLRPFEMHLVELQIHGGNQSGGGTDGGLRLPSHIIYLTPSSYLDLS